MKYSKIEKAANHETGDAVLAEILGVNYKSVILKPDGMRLGSLIEIKYKRFKGRVNFNYIFVALAGVAAEKKLTNCWPRDHYLSNDLAEVKSEIQGSPKAHLRWKSIFWGSDFNEALLAAAKDEALRKVTECWSCVAGVAEALLKRKSLSPKEVRELINKSVQNQSGGSGA